MTIIIDIEYTPKELKNDKFFENLLNETFNDLNEFITKMAFAFDYNMLFDIPHYDINGKKLNFKFNAELLKIKDFIKTTDFSNLSNLEKEQYFYSMNKLIQWVCEMVWARPFENNECEFDFQEWANKTRLGYFIYYAHAKLNLEIETNISIEQLAILAGLPIKTVLNEVSENELIGQDNTVEGNELMIRTEKAKLFLAKYQVC